MSPEDPRHGSHAGAIAHWKAGQTPCPPCGLAAHRANKRSRYDRARGLPRMTTLGEAAWGIIATTPRNQLTAATGIKADKLIRYHNGGPSMKVHRSTRNKILTAGGREYWTAVGIQRRLQALSRLGWSMRHVGEVAGVDMDGLKRLRRRKRTQFVRLTVAEAVIAAYDVLEMKIPPAGRGASRTRTEAIKEGWLPPMVWDDIDHDEQPSASGYRATKWPHEALAAEWDHLRSAGTSIDEAAKRLGVTVDAIQTAVRRRERSAA